MSATSDIRLTAILTCRNAEATLARCLEHLAWHQSEIIVIDNGSTDRSVDIARGMVGGAVAKLCEDPYRGEFDLTRQLRLKRNVINDIGAGWIIHADADEFLDTPNGQPLRDYLRLWDKSDVVAFPCDEVMFLPLSDTDTHTPENFQDTMQACVRLAERDSKQRVFRATAPLSRWMSTGGHTVAGPNDPLAPISLRLRHYFGLSLDQIRSEYLGRVYAPGDLGKLWHRTHRDGRPEVITPSPDVLHTVGSLASALPLRRAPVFASRPIAAAPLPTLDPIDLALGTSSPETHAQIAVMIEKAFPGLRTARVEMMQPGSLPCLVVFEHPALSLPAADTEHLAHAEHWLRESALSRQNGLAHVAPYAELRREDLEGLPGLLVHTIRRLLTENSTSPLLTATDPPRLHDRYSGRLRDITGSLSRDLGYG